MRVLPFALLLTASVALAEESTPSNLQPVPDGAPQAKEAPSAQPEVTIQRRNNGVVEEYRMNGKLYMVRVVPTKGLPYFLIDTDGDGDLETRRNNMDSGIMVPGWVLLRW